MVGIVGGRSGYGSSSLRRLTVVFFFFFLSMFYCCTSIFFDFKPLYRCCNCYIIYSGAKACFEEEKKQYRLEIALSYLQHFQKFERIGAN
jgi:hypothetical protein